MRIRSEGNLGRKKIWKLAFEAEHATLDPRAEREFFEWNRDTQVQVDEEEHRWSPISHDTHNGEKGKWQQRGIRT